MKYYLLLGLSTSLFGQALFTQELSGTRNEYVSRETIKFSDIFEIKNEQAVEKAEAMETAPKKKTKSKKKKYKQQINLDVDLLEITSEEELAEKKIIEDIIKRQKDGLRTLDINQKLEAVRSDFKMENTLMETDEERMRKFSVMPKELLEEDDLNIIEIDSF